MEIANIVLPFLWSGIISLYAVPSVIDLAWDKGLMDSFDKRKVHDKLTPRLGGVAIFAGTFSGILIFAEIDSFMQFFLAALLILFFLGVKDDVKEIKTWKKLVVQILVAFVVVYEGDLTLGSLKGLFGIQFESKSLLFIVSIIYIVAVTNAINFIDGLDGLAASLCTIAALTLAVFSYQVNESWSITLVCLGASLLGFLRYNLKRSLVFMGDSGSLISGFIIAVLSLNYIESQPDASGIAIIYLILFIPLTDFARVILKRILTGRTPFSAGRDHIHHLLVDSGKTWKKSLWILVISSAAMVILGTLTLTVFHFNPNNSIFAFCILSVTLSIYSEIRFKKSTS